MSSRERGAEVQIVPIDLRNPSHASALLMLLDDYASGEMGMERPLDAAVRESLIERLLEMPYYRGFLAWAAGEPVGLLNGFLGFSTFRGQTLLNVHDLSVHSAARGLGVGRRLLETACGWARDQGYCRVTLEVRSDNTVARRLYDSLGFRSGYESGVYAEFLTLSLDESAL